MKKADPAETQYMRRALRLAERGRGCVEPNPMVGCVIVRDGRIIGEGWHRRFGGPHAEVEALRRCGDAARGATAYVTLEPCCHHGKTPPCTEALIAAGVRRVVAAVRDPNPQVAGRGLRRLRRAGIEVESGLLAEQAATLIAPFAKLVTQRRPWVILKWAQSLDGKIATHTGDAKWISDEPMRRHAHRIRGQVDAIIVGRRTVECDDPLLTCRVGRPRRTATRIVLAPQLSVSPAAQLVRTAAETPTWIFCNVTAPLKREQTLAAAGCRIFRLDVPPRDVRGASGIALPAVLDVLGQHNMTNVLIEGGGLLLGGFFDAGLADELHVYVAPKLIGGAAAPGPLHAVGVEMVRQALELPAASRLRRLGGGWFLHALLREASPRRR